MKYVGNMNFDYQTNKFDVLDQQNVSYFQGRSPYKDGMNNEHSFERGATIQIRCRN